MKQLSLLILAGLTSGCFAAEQAQPASCWDLIDMMRNTDQYATPQEALEASASTPCLDDCTQNYDRLVRMAQNPQLNRQDHKSIKLIQRHLAAKRGRDSLDAVIIDDAAEQMAAATNKRSLEVAETIKIHRENAKAIIDALRTNSELIQSEIAKSNTIALCASLGLIVFVALTTVPGLLVSKKTA